MQDPYFAVPTSILPGHGLATLGNDSPEHLRSQGIFQRLKAVWECSEKDSGSFPITRKEIVVRAEQLLKALTFANSQLRKLETGTTTEQKLAAAVCAFRQMVPLISKTQIRSLISGSGAPWHHVDQGSEAMVFEADSGDIYKLMPIRETVLEVPPITSADAPIYARPEAHHLMNHFSEPTIIARVEAMNGSRGFARTEVVGITETGGVLLKQPNLGRASEVVLPAMKQLREWADLHGHEVLPSQADDPHEEVEGASSLMPIVTTIAGRLFIGTDIVPRNARNTPEGVLVFDPVMRQLLPAEIDLHPDIREAVSRGFRAGVSGT